MKYADFNRACESPSVVTLRAGGACVPGETLTFYALLLAYRWCWGFLFWWVAWRGGEASKTQLKHLSVQAECFVHKASG